jgi:hypothetical protein
VGCEAQSRIHSLDTSTYVDGGSDEFQTTLSYHENTHTLCAKYVSFLKSIIAVFIDYDVLGVRKYSPTSKHSIPTGQWHSVSATALLCEPKDNLLTSLTTNEVENVHFDVTRAVSFA